LRYDDDYGSRDLVTSPAVFEAWADPTPDLHGEALSDTAISLTILDMLDALESSLVALRTCGGASARAVAATAAAVPAAAPAPRAASIYAAPPVSRHPLPPLQEAGITAAEFTDIFGVGQVQLEDWLAGAEPAPSWVEPSIHLLGALPPSLRRMLVERNGARRHRAPVRSHPFSRIEEL
jgi:hypothetical protein